MNTSQSSKTPVLAAWIVVLLTSALPKVILQEIFGKTVSGNLQAILSVSVILAKSMQETHGLFWAWFIHFWQDVWTFSFLAIGSIIPGGG